MKTVINLFAAMTLSCGVIALPSSDDDKSNAAVSVLDATVSANNPVIQDQDKPVVPPPPEPVPQDTPAPQESPSDIPSVLVEPAPLAPPIMTPQIMAPPIMAPAAVDCCQSCCVTPCCCPPPRPQRAVFCIVDCNGCSHDACITVPACCAGEQPRISWRRGILGRQIATLCWDCCGHKSKVVITAFGKVRVKG